MASRGRPPSRGGSNFGGRGGGGFSRGGGRGGYQSYGPPDTLIELGTFKHACEGDMVYIATESRVPKFNSSIYLASKSEIGKCDEIFGTTRDPCFTVKPQSGIIATSFKTGDKVFVGGDRILPKSMFEPKPAPLNGIKKPKKPKGAGGVERGGRGGHGGGRGFSGGRGGGRGAPRGGGAPRGRGGSSSFSRGDSSFSSRGAGGGRGFGTGANRGAPRARGGFRGRV